MVTKDKTQKQNERNEFTKKAGEKLIDSHYYASERKVRDLLTDDEAEQLKKFFYESQDKINRTIADKRTKLDINIIDNLNLFIEALKPVYNDKDPKQLKDFLSRLQTK